MQRTGDQFLSGPGFADDHDRKVGIHQASQCPVDVLHGGRPPDHRKSFFRNRVIVAFGPGAGRFKAAADNVDHLVQIEGFRQVFERPAFGRLYGRKHSAMRAHDDDPHFGSNFADTRNEIETILVGHDHIGDDEVPFPVADPLPKGCRVTRGLHVKPCPPQRVAENRTNCLIVICNENRRGCRHFVEPPLSSSDSVRTTMGNITLKIVRLRRVSASMAPP